MAEKKKATKTKKLHPGGSVPGFRPMPRQLTPAQQRIERLSKRNALNIANEHAQSIGYKNARQLQAAVARMTPEQRDAFTKKHKQSYIDLQNKRRNEFETKNAKLIEKARRQGFRQANRRRMRQQNPMMPTAGISQGRPIRGRTPMPGPAPNAEAMKRMQKLMREQQARFNKMQKARMATGRAGLTRPPQDVIDQFRSGKIKTAAGEQLTLDQLMRRALRNRALGTGRKALTPAQRKAASDARRRKNRPRTT